MSLGPLLDVLSDVRTIPDGTSLHTVRLIYRVDVVGRRRCDPRSTAPPTPSDWFTPEEVRDMPAGASTSRPSWTATAVTAVDGGRPRGTTSSSSGAASAASSPPGRSSGARPGHADRPDQPPPLPAAALPGGDRDPLGGPDRPGHPRRAAEPQVPARGPGRGRAHRRRRPPVTRRRVRPAADHRLRQPDRGRRRGDLLLRARRVPRLGVRA